MTGLGKRGRTGLGRGERTGLGKTISDYGYSRNYKFHFLKGDFIFILAINIVTFITIVILVVSFNCPLLLPCWLCNLKVIIITETVI